MRQGYRKQVRDARRSTDIKNVLAMPHKLFRIDRVVDPEGCDTDSDSIESTVESGIGRSDMTAEYRREDDCTRNRNVSSRNDHKLERNEVEGLFKCGALPEQEYNGLAGSDISR